MRLFISVIATAAMFFAAGAASAETTYSAVTTVASGNPISALVPGDVVTIDVTLRSDGELTLGIGGAATGYDPDVAEFTSGTAVASFLNAQCFPGFGCFSGIDNLAPAPLAQGTLSAGILVQFATGVSTAGVLTTGTVDEGVDGVGGSAQFQLVFTVPAAAPDGSTTITLGSDPLYGNATIGAGGVSLVTNNASVTLTVGTGTSDGDSDGLTDADEINIYLTDPLAPDTDGDGIFDGDEVNVYFTNPIVPDANADTDADGLPNVDEVDLYFTDPQISDALADTDGDGLSNVDETDLYFTNPQISDALADTDGDGLSNVDEVDLYFTDPRVGNSEGIFGIESIAGALTVDHSFGGYQGGADGSGDWSGVGHGSSSPSSINFAAGSQLTDQAAGAPRDGSWLLEDGNQRGAFSPSAMMWDLGEPSDVVDVFPFTDEDGAASDTFLSATAFRLWGSNSLLTWEEATLETVWEEGYRTDATYDDYVSRWTWASSYRYVALVAGNPQTNTLAPTARIDALGVPRDVLPVNDYELDIGINVPYNLFGSNTPGVGNSHPFSVPVEADTSISGRLQPFVIVLRLGGGTFAEPLPTVGPAGSGADFELGSAFGAGGPGEWTVQHTDGGVGGTELFFTVAPGSTPSLPVTTGEAFSVASQAIRVEALNTSLNEPGRGLRVYVEYEEVLSRLPIPFIGAIKIIQTVPGVFGQGSHSVTDVAGNTGPPGQLFYASNAIRLTPEAACSGFPDGIGFFPSRNCNSSDNFQFDPQEDRIHVVLEGTGLSNFLERPGAGISVHGVQGSGPACDPNTELAYTDTLIPIAYSSQAALDFPAQANDETEFIVCLQGGNLSLAESQEIGIASWVDFGSFLITSSEPAEVRFSIIPRCFGDLNGDYRVNNADALLLRSCFPCSGIDCDRRCDFNFDGLVNNVDALAFRKNFGNTCEPPPESSYPYLAGHVMLFGAPEPVIVIASGTVVGFLLFGQAFPGARRRRPTKGGPRSG